MGIYSRKILEVVEITEERILKDRKTKNTRIKTVEYKTVKTAILDCGHMLSLTRMKTTDLMAERVLCVYCQYPNFRRGAQ
jgi:hypothetical protein